MPHPISSLYGESSEGLFDGLGVIHVHVIFYQVFHEIFYSSGWYGFLIEEESILMCPCHGVFRHVVHDII